MNLKKVKHMNIEKLIRELAKNVGKTVLNKQEASAEQIALDNIGSTDILKIILKRLVKDGQYNSAENVIFEAISKNNSQEVYEVAISFYNQLLEKSDKELEDRNFSREEVYQGLEDLENISSKHIR
jgi:hypothetical protein